MLLKALIVGGSEWDGSAWQYTPVLRTDVRPGVFEYHVPLTGDSYFGHIKAEFSEGATVSLEYTHGYDDNSSTSTARSTISPTAAGRCPTSASATASSASRSARCA